MVFWNVWSILWRMLNPQRRFYLVVLIGLLFVSGCFEMVGMLMIFGYIRGLSVDPLTGARSGMVAQVFNHLVDFPLTDAEFAIWGGVFVMLVITLKNLEAAFVGFHMSRFLSNLNHRVSEGLFAGFVRAPYELLLAERLGSPASAIQTTYVVFGHCFNAAAQIVADGAILLVVGGLLLFVDPWLTLGSVALFGVTGTAIYQSLQRVLKKMGTDETRARYEADTFLRNAFGGLVELRLQDNPSFFQTRFNRKLREQTRVQRQKQALARIPRFTNEILLAAAIVGAVVYIVLSGSSVAEALPVLGVFGFAGMRATGSMTRINTYMQTLRQQYDEFVTQFEIFNEIAPETFSSENLRDVSYLADEVPLPPGVSGRMLDEVRLEQVSFRYPNSQVAALDGLNLVIRRGAFVSFCGESGGGKSTLLKVLTGLVRPSEGTITCDGWEIHKHIRAWHRNIGYVSQSLFLASGSIRSNVAFGVDEEQIDDDLVWRALEQAQAAEFVRKLPRKLNTSLTKDGGQLSGGQRQRIVIARALYLDPEIIVFDEATAALDNVTERGITDSILALRGHKTVICVAHRLSTIRTSDTIHLLEGGRIEASGTYDDLLQQSPRFQAMAHHEPRETDTVLISG